MQLDVEQVVLVQRPPAEPMQVYVIRFGQYLKVGVTSDVAQRLRALPGGTLKPPDLDRTDVEPLCAVTGGPDTERMLHSILADARVVGEWFLARPELVAVFRGCMTDEARARAFNLTADGEGTPSLSVVDF